MSFIWTFKVLVVCGGGWLVCEGSLTPPTNTELSNNLFYLKDMNHFITSVSKSSNLLILTLLLSLYFTISPFFQEKFYYLETEAISTPLCGNHMQY